MKKIILICVVMVFLVACAEKQTIVKKNPNMEQPNVAETSKGGKKITKWDKEGLKGSAEENIKAEEEKIGAETLQKQTKAVENEVKNFESHDIHFDFDDYKIKAEDIPYLEQLAQWLLQHKDYKLTIEGHCDERGSDLYNLALGEKRANSAKDFIVAFGISPSRIITISYGEEKPLDPAHNEQAWAKNRRCHFILSK
jgi:peptidoglycan-associated lipoprotein